MSLDKCIQLRIYHHRQETECSVIPSIIFCLEFLLACLSVEFTLTFEDGAKPLCKI